MRLRTMLGMSAAVFFLLALGFLLDPPTLLKFFGLTAGKSEELLAQIFGAAFAGFGVLSWLARSVVDSTALQATVWSLLGFSAIAFVVTLLAVMARDTRSGGIWVLVVLFGAAAAGFAYFQFAGPRE